MKFSRFELEETSPGTWRLQPFSTIKVISISTTPKEIESVAVGVTGCNPEKVETWWAVQPANILTVKTKPGVKKAPVVLCKEIGREPPIIGRRLQGSLG